MVNDYRNSEYCVELKDIIAKKKNLEERIKKDTRYKIIYKAVKTEEYKKDFKQIYNYKCSYCGNSLLNLSSLLFEVDHFICESSYESQIEAGRIENIVLACYECNRAKSGFFIEKPYRDKLNPDLDEIKSIFKRDSDYYIKISDDYLGDDYIDKFYKKLKLGYETRRIDYLMLNLKGLKEKNKDKPGIVNKINRFITILSEKRNIGLNTKSDEKKAM